MNNINNMSAVTEISTDDMDFEFSNKDTTYDYDESDATTIKDSQNNRRGHLCCERRAREHYRIRSRYRKGAHNLKKRDCFQYIRTCDLYRKSG